MASERAWRTRPSSPTAVWHPETGSLSLLPRHYCWSSTGDTLPQLVGEGRGPFDLIFIDAGKPNNPDYFAWALKLSRRGSLIIVDNIVRNGAVIDAASDDPSVNEQLVPLSQA